MLAFRNLSKGEWAVVQNIGVADPVLLVIVSLGQEAKIFVASIIKPLARIGRRVLAGELRINETSKHVQQT